MPAPGHVNGVRQSKISDSDTLIFTHVVREDAATLSVVPLSVHHEVSKGVRQGRSCFDGLSMAPVCSFTDRERLLWAKRPIAILGSRRPVAEPAFVW